MVRSVDPGVTVCTTPVEIADGVQQRRHCRVPTGNVAGVTYSRHPHFEQLRIVGAVRLVAIRAILHNRRVFPEERSATLGVAAQAIFSGGRLYELLRMSAAVRV